MKYWISASALLLALAWSGCAEKRAPENTANTATETNNLSVPAPDTMPVDNTRPPEASPYSSENATDTRTPVPAQPEVPADQRTGTTGDDNRTIDRSRGTGSGPGGTVTGSQNTTTTSPTSGNSGNGNINSVEAAKKQKSKTGGQ